VKRHYVGPFLCDMCWEHLSGPAYGCDFGIHESCAGHPQALTSEAHHAHPLAPATTAMALATTPTPLLIRYIRQVRRKWEFRLR
jgi:hypothetical protein